MNVDFLRTPSGDLYSLVRIGGVKAVESGFLLLGAGAQELLEYYECPPTVAIAWRDRFQENYAMHRPGRRFPAIDWYAEAVAADPDWAASNLQPDPAPVPEPQARLAPQPKRLDRTSQTES